MRSKAGLTYLPIAPLCSQNLVQRCTEKNGSYVEVHNFFFTHEYDPRGLGSFRKGQNKYDINLIRAILCNVAAS